MTSKYINSVSTDTLIESTSNVYFVDANLQNITLTLPIITCNGMNFILKIIDRNTANLVTVLTQNGALIDNLTLKLLNPNSNLQINSYNTNWITNGTPVSGTKLNIAFSQLQGGQLQPYVPISNNSFTSFGVFAYNGSRYYGSKPIKLEVIYSINSSSNAATNFSVQIQDLTNTTIIATIGPVAVLGSSISFLSASTTTFTNIPNNLSLFELDGKLNGTSNTSVRVHCIRFILN